MPAKIRTEYTFNVPDKPGQMAKVLELLAKAGVNAIGFCGYGVGGDSATIMIVGDNEAKTEKALAAAGYSATRTEVVAVTGPSGKGAGAKIAGKLEKKGINLQYIYATTSGAGTSTVVLKVADAKGALAALK